jgi:transcriptional regulator with XRE-family HTH domain
MDAVELIKKYKKEKKMNSEELSIKSGIPLGTLTKILSRATTDPKFGTIVALAKALGCPADAFFDNNDIDMGKIELMNIYDQLDNRGKQVLVTVANAEIKGYQQASEKFMIAARNGNKQEFSCFIDDKILSAKSEDEI